MYNTGERRVLGLIRECQLAIIRWHCATSIKTHRYLTLSKSLLYHCLIHFVLITRKIQYCKVCKVKTKLKKDCIKSVALKRAV